jgi:hypothetical protein
MTGREKWRYDLRSTDEPKLLGHTTEATEIKQAKCSVRECGEGVGGSGKGFASLFGQKVVNRAIRNGLDGLLHRDPRYHVSGSSGLCERTFYAAGQTFVVHKNSVGTRIAFSRFGSDFGAASVSRQWRPASHHTTGDYFTAASLLVALR